MNLYEIMQVYNYIWGMLAYVTWLWLNNKKFWVNFFL